MQKIISLFQRNYDGDRLVRDEVVPGAEWVLAGEGVPTRKWDGTCCLVKGGKLFKRYDAKKGKTPPEGFESAQEPDPETGHWPGWLPVGGGPEDQYHREAMALEDGLPDGTYELCGPKVQGDPEARFFAASVSPGLAQRPHCLIRHGALVLSGNPRTFEDIREYFEAVDIEGIVWHHPDGRMVKIKAKDFGIKRSPKLVPT